MVVDQDWELYIDLIKESCKLQKIPQHINDSLIAILTENKGKLSCDEKSNMSLKDTFDE